MKVFRENMGWWLIENRTVRDKTKYDRRGETGRKKQAIIMSI